MAKTYCYTNKKGARVCIEKYKIRKDKTPYVQDPDSGLIIGRVSPKAKGGE